MKMFFALVCLFSFYAHAEDPKTYISAFDSKIYSLKSKGVKDFVVDVENSKLKDQLNEQMIFGKVNKLVFRLFWTASPERLAIDIIGLPVGFREVKEELKASLLSGLDNLLPIPVLDKFKGYKISQGSNPKEFVANDQSGIAPIPSYVLKFDSNDTLAEVVGKRPVGSFVVTSEYEKESFTDGKWVLAEQVTRSEENGLSVTSTKKLEYGQSSGVGVLEEVTISVVSKPMTPGGKTVKTEETIEFKNYKINTGEGLKYFLGETPKK